MEFWQKMDVLTIEIEHVATDALRRCIDQGVKVHPHPDVLDLIKDKYLQTQFYSDNAFPTPGYKAYHGKVEILKAIASGSIKYPFVQKTRSLGYDGSGIAIIKSDLGLNKIMDQPCFVEDLIDIQSEIAVMVARNAHGEFKYYEPVEMVFDPDANLLDLLVCPARISENIRKQCIDIACELALQLNITGLLAIELFLDIHQNIWVNEVAPRPHNSGHHTIENAMTSQYQQCLRTILNAPLGSTDMRSPAVMINLLGDKSHTGKAKLVGFEKILSMKNVFLHNYAKKYTRPMRKM